MYVPGSKGKTNRQKNTDGDWLPKIHYIIDLRGQEILEPEGASNRNNYVQSHSGSMLTFSIVPFQYMCCWSEH